LNIFNICGRLANIGEYVAGMILMSKFSAIYSREDLCMQWNDISKDVADCVNCWIPNIIIIDLIKKDLSRKGMICENW